MRHGSIPPVLGLLALLLGFGPAVADELAAWSALRAGGYVALMRHGDAPTNYNPAQAEIVVVRTRTDGTLCKIGRIPAPER
jgi:hypothetical protein